MLNKRQILLPLTTLLLAACAVPPMSARTSATAPQVPQSAATASADDRALILELAVRLAVPSMLATGNIQQPEPELVVAKIPSSFPASLPVPEGARILGGIVRGDLGADLIADTTQKPDAAVKFVEAGLIKGGWSKPSMMMQCGFMAANASMTMLCQSKDGPMLFINAQQTKRGVTELRYSLTTNKSMPVGAFGPCNTPSAENPGQPPQMPPLVMPSDAEQTAVVGGGGGMNTQLQFTTLQTERSTSNLLDHYGKQLETFGWTKTSSGGDANLSWSRWQGKQAQGSDVVLEGFLFVLDLKHEKPERQVMLQVTQTRK